MHAFDGQTDRQTDRILIARPRLHSLQRCWKNTDTEFEPYLLKLFYQFYQTQRRIIAHDPQKWDLIGRCKLTLMSLCKSLSSLCFSRERAARFTDSSFIFSNVSNSSPYKNHTQHHPHRLGRPAGQVGSGWVEKSRNLFLSAGKCTGPLLHRSTIRKVRYIPKVHYSECPLFRKSAISNIRYSEDPLFQMSAISNVRYSEGPLFWMSAIRVRG